MYFLVMLILTFGKYRSFKFWDKSCCFACNLYAVVVRYKITFIAFTQRKYYTFLCSKLEKTSILNITHPPKRKFERWTFPFEFYFMIVVLVCNEYYGNEQRYHFEIFLKQQLHQFWKKWIFIDFVQCHGLQQDPWLFPYQM